MKKPTVSRFEFSKYFSDKFPDSERAALEKILSFVSHQEESPEIVITNTDTPVRDYAEQKRFQNTKLIIHPNSGYDNFPLEFVKNCSAPIVIGHNIRQEAVTNYCLSAFFEHFAPIPWKKQWDPNRQWQRNQMEKLNALIIGHGHIGKSLERKLQPLVKHIDIYDPYQEKNDLNNLEQTDVIFICASLNETSINLIDDNFFEKLKDSVCLINPSRGKIIQWKSLVQFLSKNKNAFAYVDVFPVEPFDLGQVSSIKNLKTSCHIAGVFSEIEKDIINFELTVAQDFIQLNIEKFKEKYHSQLLQNKIKNEMLI